VEDVKTCRCFDRNKTTILFSTDKILAKKSDVFCPSRPLGYILGSWAKRAIFLKENGQLTFCL
jgi:hypothetical protein